VDVNTASVARVHDYLLGGKLHFAADRVVGDILLSVLPGTAQLARDGRDLLRRAVRHLVRDAGVTQFVDLGSGLPTVGNVHEIAQQIDPDARVLYVDRDPMALTHARALLGNERTTAVLDADVRDPAAILQHPITRELIDSARPIAVLASGILHYLDDEEASAAAAAVVAALPPGSYFMISHLLANDDPRAREAEQAARWTGLGPFRFRTREHLLRFLDGLELVDPGLVHAVDWHPDPLTTPDSPMREFYAAGLGRKPAG
jgi:hypothetical protein